MKSFILVTSQAIVPVVGHMYQEKESVYTVPWSTVDLAMVRTAVNRKLGAKSAKIYINLFLTFKIVF